MHNTCQKPTRKKDFLQTKLKLHYSKNVFPVMYMDLYDLITDWGHFKDHI